VVWVGEHLCCAPTHGFVAQQLGLVVARYLVIAFVWAGVFQNLSMAAMVGRVMLDSGHQRSEIATVVLVTGVQWRQGGLFRCRQATHTDPAQLPCETGWRVERDDRHLMGFCPLEDRFIGLEGETPTSTPVHFLAKDGVIQCAAHPVVDGGLGVLRQPFDADGNRWVFLSHSLEDLELHPVVCGICVLFSHINVTSLKPSLGRLVHAQSYVVRGVYDGFVHGGDVWSDRRFGGCRTGGDEGNGGDPGPAHGIILARQVLSCHVGVMGPTSTTKNALVFDEPKEVPHTRLLMTTGKPLLVLMCFLLIPNMASAETTRHLEDPSDRALRAFHKSLRRTARGIGTTRIMQFGASHTSADVFTGQMRRFFQSKFGDAGHGYVMPARPWKTYGHRDVRIDSSTGWLSERAFRKGTRKDGLYGLGGFSCASDSSEDWAKVSTSIRSKFGQAVSRFEVAYLRQPKGGRFDLLVDGEHYRRVRSRSRHVRAGSVSIRVPDGPHELEIRPVGDGEVRLLGTILERNKPGVIVDTLGINGTRASVWLHWDEALWTAQMKRRKPNLVILAYGTNEAGDTHVSINRYEEQLELVLKRLKKAAPQASCVLVGPTDRPMVKNGKTTHRERTDAIIAVQRRVSAEFRCGFWDASAAMGGPLSIVRWSEQDPPLARKDYVHLTSRGYERLGEEFSRALMRGFRPR